MLPTDKVVLIVVLKHGSIVPITSTMKHANDVIRCWWCTKEGIQNGKGLSLIGRDSMSAEQCRKWLDEAVYAANLEYSDSSGMYALAAFSWSEVTAMYVRATAPPEGEEWKYGDK
jgi:hypothetical protein